MQAHDNSMQSIVAFFPTYESAKETKDRLIDAGFQGDTIRLTDDEAAPDAGKDDADKNQSFFEWLFGNEVPDDERTWYGGKLQAGRAALSMRVNSAADMSDIEEMFAAGGALEIERDQESGIENSKPGTTSSSDAQGHASTLSDDEVIPVVNEELKVGKRASETRRFVRTYVTERPVQKQVQLEDETMVIERRPVSENAEAAPSDLQAREYEVIERHEEPVVEKQARAVEEVVVKKDVKSRTETVSDKLRETEVEVEAQAVPGKIPSQPQ